MHTVRRRRAQPRAAASLAFGRTCSTAPVKPRRRRSSVTCSAATSSRSAERHSSTSLEVCSLRSTAEPANQGLDWNVGFSRRRSSPLKQVVNMAKGVRAHKKDGTAGHLTCAQHMAQRTRSVGSLIRLCTSLKLPRHRCIFHLCAQKPQHLLCCCDPEGMSGACKYASMLHQAR